VNLPSLFLALTLEVVEAVAIVSSVTLYVIPLRLRLHKNGMKNACEEFEKREESLTEVKERTMITTVTRLLNRRKDERRIQRRPKLLVLASRGLWLLRR